MPLRVTFSDTIKADELNIKAIFTGQPSMGKTFVALQAPGPVVILDLEGRAKLYSKDIRIPKFGVLQARTPEEIVRHLEDLTSDNGKTFRTLVIDSLTDVNDMLINKGSQGGKLDLQTWGGIKRENAYLMKLLADLPMHVIYTTRERPQTEGTGGRNKPQRKTLVTTDTNEKLEMNSAVDTMYRVDTVLRFTRNGKNVTAIVQKEMPGTGLQVGQTIENFKFSDLLPKELSNEPTDKEKVSIEQATLDFENADSVDTLTASYKKFAKEVRDSVMKTHLQPLATKAKERLQQGSLQSIPQTVTNETTTKGEA